MQEWLAEERYSFPAPPFDESDPRNSLYSPRHYQTVAGWECHQRAIWARYHPDIAYFAGRLIQRLARQGIPLYVEGVSGVSATFLHEQVAYLTPKEADYLAHQAQVVASALNFPLDYIKTTATLLQPRPLAFLSQTTPLTRQALLDIKRPVSRKPLSSL